MKKLVLLSFFSLMATFLVVAADPGHSRRPGLLPQKPAANHYDRSNKPRSLRSFTLQKQIIGKSGNLNSVIEANCHQIDVDSTLNVVLFIHRSDTVTGNPYANVAQYVYDISTNGGTSWNCNIGPLNSGADNVSIGGRFPEAVLVPDSAYPTNVDSAYIIYNGSWNNVTPGYWQGQYYGVGKLDRDSSTYTQHPAIVNGANVSTGSSMIQGLPNHYWNLNFDYTQTGTSTDTIRGLIIERGVWSDSAHEVLWSYQNIPIGSTLIYSSTGTVSGNNLGGATISFDPTGKYGYIVMLGDLYNDNNFTTRPIYMSSSDFGATWSAPQELVLENLPGMFPENINATNGGKTALEAQVAVDSAGNPHIFCVVGQNDTTSNQYSFYPFQQKVLYDLYYNPAGAGCSWQANYLSDVYGYFNTYTSDGSGDGNRVQVSKSKDGKKFFVFWNDTDSADVAVLTDPNNTNPDPNLYGIGLDMGIRKVTNVFDFTAGDPIFGGAISGLGLSAGTMTGSLYPVVSQHIMNQGGGNFNIPVVLTEPDYKDPVFSTKAYVNAARYWYCSNINFTQADFINKFDNAPPTLTVAPPDTQWVLLGTAYTPPAASAYDCTYGSITPTYTSTVHTNGSGLTDSCGIYSSTWTATNPAGNTATYTQTVIVAQAPVARISYTRTGPKNFSFRDVSLYFDTARYWKWGDGTYTNMTLNPPHTYATAGFKTVILQVWNRFGTSSDTVTVQAFGTGINDLELDGKISVYPNPSSGIVHVNLAEDLNAGATITVLNILGQPMGSSFEMKPNEFSSVLDLGGLSSGAYMLKVETTGGTAVKAITIAK